MSKYNRMTTNNYFFYFFYFFFEMKKKKIKIKKENQIVKPHLQNNHKRIVIEHIQTYRFALFCFV